MQWDRNIAGILERLGASIEEGCEVSLHTDRMETPPEEQQSQQRVHREPNAYRSMKDHIHPPRVSAPSHYTPCRGCGSETVPGSFSPNFSWYGKRKSIQAYSGF